MVRNPVRRAQLVAPFGVGAMTVVRDGTSLICGGLDHWFEREDGDNDTRNLDRSEFRIEEWRLQKRLGTQYFYLPPDYRRRQRNQDIPNFNLTIPFLRFPQWHFCPRCNHLEKRPLVQRERARCRQCERRGDRSFMAQVRFIAMCDRGHVQDFPWREWAHRSANPECSGSMRLISTGGASLSGARVECDCGARRTLARIMEAGNGGNTTTLSNGLTRGDDIFLCQGRRPWLGTEEDSPCDRPIRGSLRNASNVYFALVRSAIYLPRGNEDAPQELIALMEQPLLSQVIGLMSRADGQVEPRDLRLHQPALLQPYTDDQINAALKIVLSNRPADQQGDDQDDVEVEDEDYETRFRRAEFAALQTRRQEDEFSVRASDPAAYDSIGGEEIRRYFSRVMLAERLRETRVLAGFRRVFSEGPDDERNTEEQRKLLWRDPPEERWLPAYIVYGEGIFLEFDEARLRRWEQESSVLERMQTLASRYQIAQQARRLRPRVIIPRFVLLHSFAHLLMNRLTFECGYSSAALRERLYVSADPRAPMGGVLIYTASGDAEGTMGGLVRMGKPGYLEPVIRRALEEAQWCSADPVCMEMGARGGQGPDSCNLAACHSCALVPETACEEFNRFLDRALVIGDSRTALPGFFETAEILTS